MSRSSSLRWIAAAGALTVAALTVTSTAWAAGTFSDVDEDHPFYEDIEWMAATGISTGFDDGTYRPADDVTRQAMSAFMHRASDYTLDLAVGDRAVAPAAAVNPSDPAKPFSFNGEGIQYVETPGDVACGIAPIDLPHGAVLQTIGFHGVDNGTGEVGVNLRAEELFASNSPLVLAEVFSSGASGAVQHPTAAVTDTGHEVDLVNHAYYLDVCVSASMSQDYLLTQAFVTFTLDA